MPVTCIHFKATPVPGSHNLCSNCLAAYQDDPESYLEFGDHPDGIQNWLDLEAEMHTWEPIVKNAITRITGNPLTDDFPF